MKTIKLNSFISLTEEELLERIAPVVKFQNPVSYSKKIIAFHGNSNIQQRRETNLYFYNEASQDIEPAKILTNQLDEKEVLNLSLFTKRKKLEFIKILSERLNIYNFDDFIKDKDIISHLDKLSDDIYFSNIKVIIFPFPGIDFVSAAIILDNSIIDMSLSDFYGISFKDSESIFIA
ncbi:hypothetical protein CVPH_0483 [Abyssogena phaseoliformis symbiont OG214]|uniref:hypothetical protein n=1 Tax=Abyssogena phaseoliformis symbiont TaxID=596095 RepID=UPI001914E966|nr:hypothetical protein [Abyssogena phaseoliformis symbiont]MBW5288902.1 hypothetical protein [Candidatus Ruthia sp. Apha_13_S6]BBB22559.1 hypothetical protein CVPH_0483 [Abyssogena phaseoliformis symbiont OG214]